MRKYRRRIDIIADILKAAENRSVKKTRIMYAANLSYKLLENYLDYAIKIGFMQPNENGYELTDKGRVFLEKYEFYQSRYSRLKKDLKNLLFEREALEKILIQKV